MQQSHPKAKTTILLICSIILLTCISCTTQESSLYKEYEVKWQEPMWKSAGTEEIILQYKFATGDMAQYHNRLKTTMYSEGKTMESEHTVILQYLVKEISEGETAQVLLSAKNLDTRGTGYEFFKFLPRHSLHKLGSFSISPSGHMKNVTGFIGIRSLPTFPKDPVKIGSKWTGFVDILITPILTDAIMIGECN